jgi:23S rRNA pseudouridine2605 synthase
MKAQGRQSRAEVSLARALSKFGLASRSAAVVMIRDGRVQVDGRVERNPNRWLDPRMAHIDVDGARLVAADHQYLAMHKPAGYVTTSSDERGRETVYALLPPDLSWLFPVGRLDKDSSGLLFFTNDVRWGELISGPAHRVTKTYAVTADRPVDEGDLEVMRHGMTLDDGTSLLPVKAQRAPGDGRTVVLTLIEGKNRQVRRMMEQFRYDVVALVRTAIGPITLEGLASGKTRVVSRVERQKLEESIAKERQ